MNILTELIILLFIALIVVLQLGYWVEQISNLYHNNFKSKKEFLISLIPGKMLFDFYIYIDRCLKTFRSLQ